MGRVRTNQKSNFINHNVDEVTSLEQMLHSETAAGQTIIFDKSVVAFGSNVGFP